MSPSKVVNFTIPVSVHAAIQDLSSKTGMSQSMIARLILVPGVTKLADSWSKHGPMAVAQLTAEAAVAEAHRQIGAVPASANSPTLVTTPASILSLVSNGIAPPAAPAPASTMFEPKPRDPNEPPYANPHGIRFSMLGDRVVWASLEPMCKAYGVLRSQLMMVIDEIEDTRELYGQEFLAPNGISEVSNLCADRALATQVDDWVAYNVAKLRAVKVPTGPLPPMRKPT